MENMCFLHLGMIWDTLFISASLKSVCKCLMLPQRAMTNPNKVGLPDRKGTEPPKKTIHSEDNQFTEMG